MGPGTPLTDIATLTKIILTSLNFKISSSWLYRTISGGLSCGRRGCASRIRHRVWTSMLELICWSFGLFRWTRLDTRSFRFYLGCRGYEWESSRAKHLYVFIFYSTSKDCSACLLGRTSPHLQPFLVCVCPPHKGNWLEPKDSKAKKGEYWSTVPDVTRKTDECACQDKKWEAFSKNG